MNYKIIIPLGIIATFTAIEFIYKFNILTRLKQEVLNSLSNLKTEYQRRKDLFNNLNLLIVSYIEFEKTTYKDVTKERNKPIPEPENKGAFEGILKDFVNKQIEDNKEVKPIQADLFKDTFDSKINAVSERYPKLKAFVEYKKFIEEISLTENRINLERKNYNTSVLIYMKYKKVFPNNLISFILGFKDFEYFNDLDTNEFNIL